MPQDDRESFKKWVVESVSLLYNTHPLMYCGTPCEDILNRNGSTLE
jgi:hypothetical protein